MNDIYLYCDITLHTYSMNNMQLYITPLFIYCYVHKPFICPPALYPLLLLHHPLSCPTVEIQALIWPEVGNRYTGVL